MKSKINVKFQKKIGTIIARLSCEFICQKNVKKIDCSFVVEDQEKKEAKKVYESFKWILCDLSPLLKQILNDSINQAKNCKQIVVSNPKYIEAIIRYSHTKIFDTAIINLVDFYECSKQYQVKILEDEAIKMFESEENQKKADWVKLFWLSYVKYPEDQQMRAVFEKVKRHVPYYDNVEEANMDLILEFDTEKFNILLDIMIAPGVRRIECFKIIEAYLIKHLFDGDKEKSVEDLRRIERDIVDSYLDKLQLWSLPFEYLQTLFSSKMFHRSMKIKILNEMLGRYLSSRCNTTEIYEYLRKL